MARYALIRPDNTIKDFAHDGRGGIDPSVRTKPGYRWVPAPEAQRPAYDPETQVIEGPVRTVGASEVTETYSVRAKTAAELDADKDAKISIMDRAQLRVLFNHENRIRALEGKQAITQAQFVAAVKALL
jgi:hypothetical protein